jgi:molybdenum cofactor cytidylyltransferase
MKRLESEIVTAVLLAAGESRRMGDFKQLLRLGDKTFVEHCVDQLLASGVGELIVVTGHRDSDVQHAVGRRPVRFAHNADYRSGMASSIKCGIRAASENAGAFLIALVDQPQIQAETVSHLIQAYEKERTGIVIPRYDGRNGHPILLDGRLKEEILNMNLEEGLREVVRAHADEILRIDVSSRAVVDDCDLPEDFQRLLGS